MPRNYIKKQEGPSYSLEDIQKAVEDVKMKRRTYRDAGQFYGIPTAVIFHRIKGRNVSIDKMGAGVSKALPDNVEEYLVNCLQIRARMGIPCQKSELKLLVCEYVTQHNIKTPFKNNTPGDDWYQNFMKRNPNLSLKKPELLQKARVDARKPHVVYHFYELLDGAVKKANLENKPMYIFNTDESGFHNDPNKVRGIGEKGVPLSRISGGSGRDSTTVLACVSADGSYMPPLIVFKGVAVQPRWTSESAYPGTLYGATRNGWMEEPTFYNWFTTGFVPYVNKLREERNEADQHAILIYDGHASHISLRIVEEALKNNITLLKFPSHLTDRIQPLDKCVFGPVKTAWDKLLVDHGIKQMGKGTGRLNRDKFSELLGQVWEKALTLRNIQSGFESTGIFPVNAKKFPKKMFCKDEIEIYENLVTALSSENLEQNDVLSAISEECIIQSATLNDNLSSVSLEVASNSYAADAMDAVQTHQAFSDENRAAIDSNPSHFSGHNTTIHDHDYDKHPQPEKNALQQEISTDQIDFHVGLTETQKRLTQQNSVIQCTPRISETQKKRELTSNHSADLSDSPSLVNKIMKLISLDQNTRPDVKSNIINAITVISSACNLTNSNELKSPSKESLEKKFGIHTPKASKKVVVPRLKPSAFGEVLTSNEVLRWLKEAEESKAKPKKNTRNLKKSKEASDKQEKESLEKYSNEKLNPTKKRPRKFIKKEGNSNIKSKKVKKLNKKREIREKLEDNTSNSDINMSVHSDSDIADVTSERSFEIEYEENRLIVSHEDFFENNVHFHELHQNNLTSADSDAGPSRVIDESPVANYSINDTVLVRYISMKKVEYFVGKIESKMGKKYKISFFRKTGRGDSIMFYKQKREDIDLVEENMIVKQVELMCVNDQETQFSFLNDEDSIFFD